MSAGLWGWSSGALSLLHLGMLVFIFIHNILTKGKVDMRQVELVLGKLQLRDDQRIIKLIQETKSQQFKW